MPEISSDVTSTDKIKIYGKTFMKVARGCLRKGG